MADLFGSILELNTLNLFFLRLAGGSLKHSKQAVDEDSIINLGVIDRRLMLSHGGGILLRVFSWIYGFRQRVFFF